MRVALGFVIVILCLGSATFAGEQGKVVQLGGGHSYQWTPKSARLALVKGDDLWLYDVTTDTLWRAGHLPSAFYACLNDSQIVCVVYPKLERRSDTVTAVTLAYFTIPPPGDSLAADSESVHPYTPETGPRIRTNGAGATTLYIQPQVDSAETDENARRATDSMQSPYVAVVSHCPSSKAQLKELGDTDIWLMDRFGNLTRRVTFGKQYILPNLSPDGLKITASDMAGHRLVLDTMGNEIGRFPGGGDNCWSYDSRTVYYTTVVQSEWDVIGGDLFAYSLSTKSSTQLTFSPDRPEFEPRVSPDGRMLAYRGYTPGNKTVVELLFLQATTE
jgi:hypothetical protein